MLPALGTLVYNTYNFSPGNSMHPIGCAMQDFMWFADPNEPPAAFCIQARPLDGAGPYVMNYEQFIISGSGGTPTLARAGTITTGPSQRYCGPIGLPLPSLPTACAHYLCFLGTGLVEFKISVVAI